MRNRSYHGTGRPIWMTVGKILLGLLLLCALCYGLLLLALGLWEQHTLADARSRYTAVTVAVTELSPSAQKPPWYLITLEPVERTSGKLLGKTCTTLYRPSLSVGDSLTMYYDPADPNTRIVDFQTANGLIRRGILLTAVTGSVLLLWGIAILRRKQRRQPAVMLEDSHEK